MRTKLIIALSLLLISLTMGLWYRAQQPSVPVYVTVTGSQYHVITCPTIYNSEHITEFTVTEARQPFRHRLSAMMSPIPPALPCSSVRRPTACRTSY
jgi:hypothetical protein